ncbi:MAG: hypothetical protein EOP13_09265 [Pseudomonas sp.]|jgi:hypothetical protein|uniref:hypothetical protein n=1 Tax=Pseudomonas sp. TaxID=306 RepID=UPI0011F603F9|nr:hypothetical protein [Pseudomonas sp.]RZI74226.1 MAG: hypothetical protein EOP13_09265 [Pseudomonas sp.]
MRILGLAGLVLVLLISGFVVKRQASGQEAARPSDIGATSSKPDSDVRNRQVRQHIQRSLDATMRASRDVSGEP